MNKSEIAERAKFDEWWSVTYMSGNMARVIDLGHYKDVAWESWKAAGERAIAESQAPQPSAYMCPSSCGCLWRDNRDGTMSLFGHNSKSCEFCEVMALGSLIPLYERVTATKEQPEGAEWKPDSMQVNAAPFLGKVGTCRTPHFLGEPTPDRKALTQIPHYELPNGLCKEWRQADE